MARKPRKEAPTITKNGKIIGRPRLDPRPQDFERIVEAASQGYGAAAIARSLGVSRETLQLWRREHPVIAEAFDLARDQEHKLLYDKLIEKALAGDTVCILFALKTRHGYREGQPLEGTSSSRVQIEIKLPGALAPAQYAEVIDHE